MSQLVVDIIRACRNFILDFLHWKSAKNCKPNQRSFKSFLGNSKNYSPHDTTYKTQMENSCRKWRHFYLYLSGEDKSCLSIPSLPPTCQNSLNNYLFSSPLVFLSCWVQKWVWITTYPYRWFPFKNKLFILGDCIWSFPTFNYLLIKFGHHTVNIRKKLCLCKNMIEIFFRRWYHFNDSSVSLLDSRWFYHGKIVQFLLGASL